MQNRRLALVFFVAFSALVVPRVSAATPQHEIEQFNDAFAAATRHMDNAATLALWADDGVSLLPSTPPIVGKKAIGAFLDGVMKQLAGAHMESFDMRCHAIEVSGPWASEWCSEHQVVKLGDGKTFDGWGKMLLVLHRQSDGRWTIAREMWNQASPSDF
ncbi:MAG: DUF4440 domain-containing protein [Acidobacteria bacterium]|nr:DUF4440 domain-containing protein [Acidobacteriota bacterium]MBV9477518.1 DUF4440 domain-containing protein [Acidobacteriota bacterium]